MSRYELEPKSDTPHVARVAVGWDRPLQTFFAEVQLKAADDGDEDEAKIALWEGTAVGEIPDASHALALIAPYAVVPADMLALLEADRERTRGAGDGPLQQIMKRLILRSAND